MSPIGDAQTESAVLGPALAVGFGAATHAQPPRSPCDGGAENAFSGDRRRNSVVVPATSFFIVFRFFSSAFVVIQNADVCHGAGFEAAAHGYEAAARMV